MKLTRVFESEGQNFNPENSDSTKFGLSRRGFIAAAR